VSRAGDGVSRTVYTLSEEETRDLGRAFAAGLRGGELLALVGDLGAGKTVFVRGLAAGLGAGQDLVASPSFVLCREYGGGRLPLFHVDLYRLGRGTDLGELALEELLELGSVVAVEWGEKLPERLRREAVEIRFQDLGENSRRITVHDHRAGPDASPAASG
jgi:tRNA threonylcarbamoyladenosine biosynthesis protein TsaE